MLLPVLQLLLLCYVLGVVHNTSAADYTVTPPTPYRAAWTGSRENEAAAGKIGLYYSGWQLLGQRPDQPTPGDSRNLTRVYTLVQRGFTHVMIEDGNLEVNRTIQPLDTLRWISQQGLAPYINVGWSLHLFYEDPAQISASVRRQYSPFVNRTGWNVKVKQIERIIRAASPWLAGVMNDLEFPPWVSDFPDLPERLGNQPSASAPEWPSFTDWPTFNAHQVPAGSNWTLEKLFFNMPRWTHNGNGDSSSNGAPPLRIAGTSDSGPAAVSMVAQLFRPRATNLARVDLWLRLTTLALPKMPYISYYVAPLKADGTPDTDHPVLCAIPRPQPDIVPYATGKFIKCGVHATELVGLVQPNATEPSRQPNTSAWLPMKLVCGTALSLSVSLSVSLFLSLS